MEKFVECSVSTGVYTSEFSKEKDSGQEGSERHTRRETASNRKGCDLGYALAANSCEGVRSVDACTVTALDAITAFAVPNPNGHLAAPSVFSGLEVQQVAPLNPSPSLLRTGYF
jgi:hypothetical protein